jgi:hypothetical protein
VTELSGTPEELYGIIGAEGRNARPIVRYCLPQRGKMSVRMGRV